MSDFIRPLAEGFTAADDARWRELCEAALKGAPFDRLVRKTLDGVERGPLFSADDIADLGEMPAPGASPYLRGLKAERDRYLPWAIRQTIDIPDPKSANTALLSDLSGGVSEISLMLDPLGEQGVAVRTLDELKQALDGVMMDLAPIHLLPNRMAPQYAAMLIALIDEWGLDKSILKGGLGLSPIGQKSMAGGGAAELPERLLRTAEAAAHCAHSMPGMKVVNITANASHEAGASEAQELAFACAGGASYMRTFIDHGLSADEAANALEFSIAADADIHLTIAKIRAARRVWAQITEAFGCSAQSKGMHICAVTSGRMLTARDAWTNLIRNTCAGFGAAVGGADAITIKAFNEPLGAATPFARRVGRNLQVMLMEESHLGQTADPAGGGYLHETLSHRLAKASWAIFQDIEQRGGLFEAVKSGWLQTEIEAVKKTRMEQYALGQESLIGVSQFPSFDEREIQSDTHDYTPPELDAPEIQPQSFAQKIEAAKSGAMVRILDKPDQDWAPLTKLRLSEPFERLRDNADAFTAQNGEPTVFPATLGALADFNARVSFASNRLAVAGVHVQAALEHSDIEACVAAFKDSGCRLAVICGRDEAYIEHAEPLIAALKKAGAQAVWVAGKPMAISNADHFIHMRSNALEDGEKLHAILGIEP